MRQPIASKNGGETPENGKAPSIVAQKIREGIPEEVFLPGEHLKEIELAERFEVSRSPIRETLLALEKEGTVMMIPYKGAMVKPLTPEEILDVAELRLALISMVLRPAYRHLSPADFEGCF